MSIECTIRVNKAKAKDNITYSISKEQSGKFRSVNFTGSLVRCRGYETDDGVNLDRQVVEANIGATLLITDNRIGASVAKTAQQIFNNRKEKGDRNPTIEINFRCETLTPTETNILAKGISDIEINANVNVGLKNDSKTALANLEKAKKNRARTAANAAKSALGGLSSLIKEII